MTDHPKSSIWWIDEGRLAGSPNPTQQELGDLRSMGFATVVCLLREPEAPNYDRELAEGSGYHWYSLPVRDHSAPDMRQFRDFLNILEGELKRGRVLVHCQGGSGRTGAMGAAYWIARGCSAKQALAKVRQARPAAVETKEQERSLAELESELARRSPRKNSEQ